MANIASPDEATAVAIQTIESHLDTYGVRNASVTRPAANAILVQLPGLKTLVTEICVLDFMQQLYDSGGKPV